MSDSDGPRRWLRRPPGYRWLLRTIGFTLAACLAVALAVSILFLVSAHATVGSERARSLFALGLFVTAVAASSSLLVALKKPR